MSSDRQHSEQKSKAERSYSRRPLGVKEAAEAEERQKKKAPAKYCVLAKELAGYTEKTVYNITKPTNGKGHRFLVGTRICETAIDVMSSCYATNEIYPLTVRDYLKRREHLQNALGSLSTLEGLIEIAKDNVQFSSSILEEWTLKLNDTKRWVKGVYNSDTESLKSMVASRGKNSYVSIENLLEALAQMIE